MPSDELTFNDYVALRHGVRLVESFLSRAEIAEACGMTVDRLDRILSGEEPSDHEGQIAITAFCCMVQDRLRAPDAVAARRRLDAALARRAS